MGIAYLVPVPSCQCQGAQVASKLKAAREQIAQRLAELRKKNAEKLSFWIITMQLSSMVFAPNISFQFIPLPIDVPMATCLSEEWPLEEEPPLWGTWWHRQGYLKYVKSHYTFNSA